MASPSSPEASLAALPPAEALEVLREAAAGCTACPLYRDATQTVFGEGPATAKIVLVGEQPGDQEDLAGRPFVGPAGALLRRAMAEAGLEEDGVWITNAVKHFKWEPRGKRRLHAKPDAHEMRACQPWLLAELGVLRPRMLVLLGATAVHSLLGPDWRVTRDRGRHHIAQYDCDVVVTVHPSSLLRMPDEAARHAAYASFVTDLRLAVA